MLYTRLINFDVDRFSYYDTIRLIHMIAELWILQEGTMKGHVMVCDIHGVRMSHALRIPLSGVKKSLYYLQEAAPIRLKALHYLNTTSVMDFMLALMKPFIKKELMDIVSIIIATHDLCMHISFND